MIKKRLLTAFFLSLLCCFPLANSAFAANLGDAFGVRNGSATDPLDTAASAANYKIGVANTEITPFFSKVISFGLSFLGVIFLLLILYGGFLWMTDRGNEDQVAKAKKLIQAAVIGLVIVVSSYAISILVIKVLTDATQK